MRPRHNLHLRQELVLEIKDYIRENKLTQRAAAEVFHTSQPRICNLMQNQVELFSLDYLVNMLSKIGVNKSLHGHHI